MNQSSTVKVIQKILSLILLSIVSFNLSAASYSNGSWDYKLPDEIGNLFKTKERKDRQYGRAGQLLKDEKYTYTYDEVGNLIKKESLTETWRYKWTQGGMLSKVIRPDKKHVDFTYDALGRRLTKTYQDQTTHFVWDGNVPLHEWTASVEESNSVVNEKGEAEHTSPENLTTWIFEDGTFIPMAKLQGESSYSIITDHLGTPVEAYDEDGTKVWSRELNIYGETRKEFGVTNFIPVKYQGQYEDVETGLYYNRFRYYSPESGTYISQDPIKLYGSNPTLYAYTHDVTSWIDPYGLDELVYQLLDANDNVIYCGITERSASTRMAEHIYDGKQFSKMQVLAEGLSHDQARSIEGALIRQRLAERIGDYSSFDSIEDQLRKSGLLNKNRGRTSDRWLTNNPLNDLSDKMHAKPKNVKC